MEQRVASAGGQCGTATGHDHTQSQQQEPAPPDLLTEEDHPEHQDPDHQLEGPAAVRGREADDAECGGDSEAQGEDDHRSDNGDEQRAPGRAPEPHVRPRRFPLAGWEGDEHGDRHCDDRHEHADQRGDSGPRKRERDRQREGVGDGEEDA
ncbi:MAG TPA: hypothetical protein VNO83_07270, partial [Pseudonocardia sp.]|nr:hypothetical protein [Pseudonocardia sp.]